MKRREKREKKKRGDRSVWRACDNTQKNKRLRERNA